MRYELVEKDYQMMLNNLPGVATDSKDNVYITIRAPLTPIVVFNRAGEFLRGMGTGMGIQNPHAIALDAEDNIYLVDTNRQVVHKITQEDKIVLTLGTLDKPAAESGSINGDLKTIRRGGPPFNFPAGVAVSRSGDIFVADGYGNARIHRFSKEGELIGSVGEPGTGNGQFRVAHGIAVDDDAREIYVADRENFRIQIFDFDGGFKRMWTELRRPTDVCVRNGLVYVAEMGELLFNENVYYDPRYHRHPSRVRVFDKLGRQLAQIGADDGSEPGSFLGAHGIAADSFGDVLVAEINGVGMPTRFHPAYQRFRPIG